MKWPRLDQNFECLAFCLLNKKYFHSKLKIKNSLGKKKSLHDSRVQPRLVHWLILPTFPPPHTASLSTASLSTNICFYSHPSVVGAHAVTLFLCLFPRQVVQEVAEILGFEAVIRRLRNSPHAEQKPVATISRWMWFFFSTCTFSARLESAITVHHPHFDTVWAFSLLDRQQACLQGGKVWGKVKILYGVLLTTGNHSCCIHAGHLLHKMSQVCFPRSGSS